MGARFMTHPSALVTLSSHLEGVSTDGGGAAIALATLGAVGLAILLLCAAAGEGQRVWVGKR